jgi:hypothetical protein
MVALGVNGSAYYITCNRLIAKDNINSFNTDGRIYFTSSDNQIWSIGCNVNNDWTLRNETLAIDSITADYNTGAVSLHGGDGTVRVLSNLDDVVATPKTDGTFLFYNSTIDEYAFSINTLKINDTTNFDVAIGYEAGNLSQGSNSIAIGHDAGGFSQGASNVAIGYRAGLSNQGDHSISIGDNAGGFSQGLASIAIGDKAGSSNQGASNVAIGISAGYSNQGLASIAIGDKAGSSNQSFNSIAMGLTTGFSNQGHNCVAIGTIAGREDQGDFSTAIGYEAGEFNQSNNSVAIGNSAGRLSQNFNCVAIGNRAGRSNQGEHSISIGDNAGYESQGDHSVAIGFEAGDFNQGASNVAIGVGSGKSNQEGRSISIGVSAGYSNQGDHSIAIGMDSGAFLQHFFSIALGYLAGSSNQSFNSIAMGLASGFYDQGHNSVAIGTNAGYSNQGDFSTAIGYEAGGLYQKKDSVAIGTRAGRLSQNFNCVAIGNSAGTSNQGLNSIAIGNTAGFLNQGSNSIAIGDNAGIFNQASDSIALNAGVDSLIPDVSGTFINPIRTNTTDITNAISYSNTKEVCKSSFIYFDNSNNRIGIGVSNPEEDLEVDGSIQIDSANVARLKFQQSGLNPHALGEIDGEQDGTNGGDLQFYTKVDGASLTEKLRINNQGAIGIGGANFGTSGQVLISDGSGSAVSWADQTDTTYTDGLGVTISPANVISIGQSVAPTATPTFNGLEAGSGTVVAARMRFNFWDPPNPTEYDSCRMNHNLVAAFSGKDLGANNINRAFHNIYYSGNLTPVSDNRFKHNESVIRNALQVMRLLSPKIYDKTLTPLTPEYNGDLSNVEHWKEAGFISQEVEQIPELQFAVKNGMPLEDGYIPKFLVYNNLFVYNISALKELDTLVQQQQVVIQNLITRIEALESK